MGNGARQLHLTQDDRPANFRVLRVATGLAVTGRVGTARILSALAVLAAIGVLLRRSVGRIEVVGSSMEPTFLPGDRLVLVGRPWRPPAWPRPGQVVAVRDPRLPERILVKRVGAVDRGADTLEVLGDAPGASTDSRAFGPVPRSSLVGRAVYRYAPVGRSGRGPWPGEYHLR